jgi:hypothetical protein
MKGYLVFGGLDYYPAGGWDDLIAVVPDYPEVEEVEDDSFEQGGFRYTDFKLSVLGRRVDWVQIVNAEDGTAACLPRPDQRKAPLTPAPA